jgi:hypothetical protein
MRPTLVNFITADEIQFQFASLFAMPKLLDIVRGYSGFNFATTVANKGFSDNVLGALFGVEVFLRQKQSVYIEAGIPLFRLNNGNNAFGGESSFSLGFIGYF